MGMMRMLITLSFTLCYAQNTSIDNICMFKNVLQKYTGVDTFHFTVAHLVHLLDGMRAEYCQTSQCFLHPNNLTGNYSAPSTSIERTNFSCDPFNSLQKHAQCISGSKLMMSRGFQDVNRSLTATEVIEITPLLLYQIAMTPCIKKTSSALVETLSQGQNASNGTQKAEDHDHDDKEHDHDDEEHDHDDEEHDHTLPASAAYTGSDFRAWLGGVGAVVIISVIGLGVIGVVPLVKKSVYDVLIQFLVALAVGTLVGDALLHLLPHAMSEAGGHDHSKGQALTNVWRGFVSVMGIILFFNAERIIGIVTMYKNKTKTVPADLHSLREVAACGSCNDSQVIVGHSSHEMHAMADAAHKRYHERMTKANSAGKTKRKSRHSHHKKRKKKLDEIAEDVDEPVEGPSSSQILTSSKAKRRKSHGSRSHKKSLSNSNHSGANQSRVSIPTAKADSDAAANNNANESNAEGSNKSEESTQKSQPDLEAAEELGSSQEGHGHSHEVPTSCTSVAYMVMMGDGLHNLTDGLAIGAAFASSFTGGLSTAVAVLCHELPHELGDFAILLKSGMSVKQALLCNLLSACLQLGGALLGVALGSIDGFDISQWLFAFAAGLFLYIGLVDMLPEISKIDKTKPKRQLLLQNAGLFTGIGIMLLIAVFESDLETLFGNEQHEAH